MTVELLPGRRAAVGTGEVTRLLPYRTHRTVGAWCFADHFGPEEVDEAPMAVGPHPHIGLQTVTWLFDGEARHTDSLGSDQVIRPGQLNLMTSGRGIAHAEQSPTGSTGTLHGMQLWVALPEATRHGDGAFEHLTELPEVDLSGGTARVLVGSLGDVTSPARADWPIVGAELTLRSSGRGAAEVPLDPTHEHAVLTVSSAVTVDGVVVEPGTTAYLAPGAASVEVAGAGPVLLLGGAPFEAPILMSWNFVARTPDEIDAAYADWAATWDGSGAHDRFGDVRSTLAKVPAPPRR